MFQASAADFGLRIGHGAHWAGGGMARQIGIAALAQQAFSARRNAQETLLRQQKLR
jgi:hypothetical protein